VFQRTRVAPPTSAARTRPQPWRMRSWRTPAARQKNVPFPTGHPNGSGEDPWGPDSARRVGRSFAHPQGFAREYRRHPGSSSCGGKLSVFAKPDTQDAATSPTPENSPETGPATNRPLTRLRTRVKARIGPPPNLVGAQYGGPYPCGPGHRPTGASVSHATPGQPKSTPERPPGRPFGTSLRQRPPNRRGTGCTLRQEAADNLTPTNLGRSRGLDPRLARHVGPLPTGDGAGRRRDRQAGGPALGPGNRRRLGANGGPGRITAPPTGTARHDSTTRPAAPIDRPEELRRRSTATGAEIAETEPASPPAGAGFQPRSRPGAMLPPAPPPKKKISAPAKVTAAGPPKPKRDPGRHHRR